ncbi:MAG: ParB/RepB/Spo0J family partition protein [Bythopirellula sp.]|nr:ParB/RepB/Spo0J family partition protein [Bythopirellula sp.]
MNKERRLGRGLEALLGFSAETPLGDQNLAGAEQPSPAPQITDANSGGQQWLDLAMIDRNPYQPRQQFDEAEIADLCDSIRAHGFLQPIVVRPLFGRFQIIAGERRYRAAQLAAWQQVPVLVREADDRQMAELAIVENVQRKDLNALEKAASFQRYLQEYGCTQEELANRVNIDRSTVANLIRLLELPEQVKTLVATGEISQGHARALLPLGDEEEQKAFAKRIAAESLSVRVTEQLVQEHIQRADGETLKVFSGEGTSSAASVSGSEHLSQLEDQLRLALGTKVELRQSAKGKGKITIHFGNHDEFDRIKAILTGSDSMFREVG